MFKLEIITPVASLPELLASLEKELDTTRIEDEASAMLLNRLRTNFLAERAPDGKPWPKSRAGQIRRSKGGTGTLFATGTLFRSIQLSSLGSGGRAIRTDVPYAAKHQLGQDGLPQRQFLGVVEQDGLDYEKLLLKRLQKALS